MRATIFSAAACCLFLFDAAATSQPVTGLPPFGSFSGGPFDTVNNANLNVHFEVPVFSRAGRGLSFSYSLWRWGQRPLARRAFGDGGDGVKDLWHGEL